MTWAMNITVSENIKQRFENIKLWLADIMMAHSIKYGQVPDRDDATHYTAHTTGTEGQWSIWCMYYMYYHYSSLALSNCAQMTCSFFSLALLIQPFLLIPFHDTSSDSGITLILQRLKFELLVHGWKGWVINDIK